MIAIRLGAKIESRLKWWAKRTGCTQTGFACEAILEHLEDLDDVYLASKRLKRPAKAYSAEEVKIYSAEEVKGELGL